MEIFVGNGLDFTDLRHLLDVAKKCSIVLYALLSHTVTQDHHLHIHFFSLGLEKCRKLLHSVCINQTPQYSEILVHEQLLEQRIGHVLMHVGHKRKSQFF